MSFSHRVLKEFGTKTVAQLPLGNGVVILRRESDEAVMITVISASFMQYRLTEQSLEAMMASWSVDCPDPVSFFVSLLKERQGSVRSDGIVFSYQIHGFTSTLNLILLMQTVENPAQIAEIWKQSQTAEPLSEPPPPPVVVPARPLTEFEQCRARLQGPRPPPTWMDKHHKRPKW